MTETALYEEAEVVTINDLDVDNDYVLVINTSQGGSGLKRLKLNKVAERGILTPAVVADGASTAITAAQLLSRVLTMATTTSGRAPVVPTGTAINGILAIGESIEWSLINTGNQTLTLTGNTGHTLIPTVQAQATLTTGRFRTVCTAANTAITYRIS